MNKLWLVSAAYGTPQDGCVMSGTWICEDAPTAVGMMVSKYYLDHRGTPRAQLPLSGVNVMEMPLENIEAAAKVLREQPTGAQQGAAVLSLVPTPPPMPERDANYYRSPSDLPDAGA